MSRTDWPKLCSLADASRLFAEEGVQVHRSNLSRFVASRSFPKIDGKVDPAALFDAFATDYGRQMMAGQTGNASPGPSQVRAPAFPANSPPPADDAHARDDPNRDLKRIQAQQAQLALQRELGKTAPVEEVRAAFAECVAELRAAMLQAAREDAARLCADLGAPGHKVGAAVAALKRYADKGQEKFAERAAKFFAAVSASNTPERAHLDALVAYDLELRGEGDSAPPESLPETPPAPEADAAE